MKKQISLLLVLVLLLTSVPAFAAESFEVDQMSLNDNTMIIGQYAFDFNETQESAISLENFITASQSTHFKNGQYHVYYKAFGKWFDLITDSQMNNSIDANSINGDGKVTYLNMKQASPGDSVYETSEERSYKMNDVTLEGVVGTEASDYKLGFLEADNMDSVTAYCIVWSTTDFKGVHDALIGSSRAEIEEMSVVNEDNSAYLITNLSWADGIGNTFNSGQNDVISGREFSWPGIHHFYVLTLSDDAVLAVTEAQKHASGELGVTVDINPAPLSVTLEGSGTDLSDYAVSVNPFTEDTRVLKDFIFVSELGFDSVYERIHQSELSEIEDYAAAGKGLLRDSSDETAQLSSDLKLLEGKAFGEGAYYVYAAHVGTEGLLGISKSLEMIVTAPLITPPAFNGDGPGTGKVIAAGGSVSDDNDAFFNALRIEGDGTRVAIINTSHGNESTIYNYFYMGDDTYPALKGRYEDLGFEAIYIPLGIDNYEYINNNAYFASLVESCDAIYLQGGDQAKHAKALLEDDGSPTLIADAIKAVYERGGVVAGTSAGSHVLSDPMYGWGTPGDVILLGGTEVKALGAYDPTVGEVFPSIDGNNMSMPGLGLIPDYALTDTHFDARGRLGRLVQGLYDTGKKIGIGSDEGTALSIQDNIGTVVGLRGVTIVDMTESAYDDSEYPCFKNVIVHYLTEGDTYNFKTGEVTSVHNLIEDYEGTVYESTDIFSVDSKYEVTHVLNSLISSEVDAVISRADISIPKEMESDLQMNVSFRRTADTRTYCSNMKYFNEYGEETSGLENMYKFTADTLYMDIEVLKSEEEKKDALFVNGIRLKSNSEYTQYIELSQAVDAYSCVSGSSIRVNASQALYDSDFYDSDYPNEIRISLDNPRTEGDKIILEGIKGENGSALPKQTWVFDGDEWHNDFYVESIQLKEGSDYTQYIVLNREIDATTLLEDETIMILENTLYDTDFYDEAYPNEIRISLSDARADENIICLKNIKDADGNEISEEIWVFCEGAWIKR